MPIYEYKCKKCGSTKDKFNRMVDHKKGPRCCGKVMGQHYGNYYVVGDIQPYLEENIGDKPVVVKSKKHREQLMKENGVYEKVGKNWI
jgi:putative FmdB family regulatory protein